MKRSFSSLHFLLKIIICFVLPSRSRGNSLPNSVMGGLSASTNDIARLSLSSSVSESSTSEEQGETKVRKLQKNDEKRLLDALMSGYDRNIRPVQNASHAIMIHLGITLTQIFDMDEKNQVLTTNVWLDQEWEDELLYWNPSLYNGLETIRLPCEMIWLPDIVLYNNADDYTRGYMNSRAMVSYKGKVFWPPPTKFRSTCPVDVTYFPFDDQTCILKLGSWIYDGFQVDVTNRTSDVDLTNYIPNGEWELLDATIVRNVIYYSCCPEPFPDVTIKITIRRKTLYYMYNVVLPCMMMSVLTLLVFCLPPDSGEKIALGVTVLLAFSVFMLAIAEKMPETSESIPLIGIYLTAVMTITSISIIMTVIVLNCHYRGPIQREVPYWLRKYFLETESVRRMISGKLINRPNSASIRRKWKDLVKLSAVREQKKSCSLSMKEENHHHPHSKVITQTGAREYTNNVINDNYLTKPETIRLRVESIGEDSIRDSFQPDFASSIEDIQGLHSGWKEHNDPSKRIHNNSQSPLSIGGGGGGGAAAAAVTSQSKAQDEILKALKVLISRQEREDSEKKRLKEWRTIAIAIDRVLFWVFFVVTTISSFVFLVILPVVKRSSYVRDT